MHVLIALLLGLLFGLGLIISGMTDPAKVLAFLDFAGLWDPSLGLVMAGAIGVAVWPFRQVGRRGQSWLGGGDPPAEAGAVDRSLIVGSVLFGIGWGLSGLCPGPALVGLGAGYLPAAVFVIAMIFGMEAYEWMRGAQKRRLKASAGK